VFSVNLLSARYADGGHIGKEVAVSTQSEANRLSLAYYRKQAKALLKAAQAGDAESLARVAGHSRTNTPALHDAQLTIAREQGFAAGRALERLSSNPLWILKES
jgi:hypothetical protein